MGPTGVGKSAVCLLFQVASCHLVPRFKHAQFIEHATKANSEFIGLGSRSQMPAIQGIRTLNPADGKPVVFVETPGFNDTNQSDMETISQIAGLFINM